MRQLLFSAVALLCCSGCTIARHAETRPDGSTIRVWYGSLGVKRSVGALDYGPFKLRDALSDESKGVEAAATGIVKGAKP